MEDLVVKFGGRIVEDEDNITAADIKDADLDIDWNKAPGVKYSLIIIKNYSSPEKSLRVLYRRNISQKESGEYVGTTDLSFRPARYLVKLYRQDKRAKLVDEIKFIITKKSRQSDRLVLNIPHLSQYKRSYCSCVVQLAIKQSLDCLRNRNWDEEIAGGTSGGCSDPHRACSRLPRVNCQEYYNYEAMTDRELVSLALLRNIDFEWDETSLSEERREELIALLSPSPI